MGGYAFAVDIGGTFTDIVLRHDDGRTWVDKTLTTYEDLLDGFFIAVDAAMEKAGATPADVDDVIVHATTVVTNAVLTRSGQPTALFVTEGFKDVLFIRDEHRYDMFDPQIEYADPIVPRDLTWGVAERTLANGTVSMNIDEVQIRQFSAEMREKGVDAVGICLLNAYVNGTNEQRVRDILLQEWPELYVSISSEVAPQIREYPRAATTALNAYTRPITEPYLTRLSKELETRGFASRPLIMMSNGGVLGTETASQFPVRMMESGPAAGALVASYYAERLGLDRLMSFDMGGTTAKACLIEDRKPLVTGLFEVDRMYRFKSGSGMPVIIPAIDMIEIGAGGGSLASVDSLGLLKVGPRSAGSEPGPACYGRGGENPAVTDADLVIGILDADNFLGGEMQLDKAAAEGAIKPLADRLKTSVPQTARGIFQVVNESMAAAARACHRPRHRLPRHAGACLWWRRAGARLPRGGAVGINHRDLPTACQRVVGIRHPRHAGPVRPCPRHSRRDRLGNRRQDLRRYDHGSRHRAASRGRARKRYPLRLRRGHALRRTTKRGHGGFRHRPVDRP